MGWQELNVASQTRAGIAIRMEPLWYNGDVLQAEEVTCKVATLAEIS